ncbi:hypothetical protein KCP71_06375 [Salmonella enterica subsp. enterica]|nr:hypothetical protein KCP71_06375 [Salmonella enterica subsp. enterica]
MPRVDNEVSTSCRSPAALCRSVDWPTRCKQVACPIPSPATAPSACRRVSGVSK